MAPDLLERASQTLDFCALTKDLLALCEPFGAVHSFKLVHNRGAGRVACTIELESTKQEPALARALGGRSVNGAVCVELEVGPGFEKAARRKVVAIAPQSVPETRIAAP
ncbi:MAG TPA: hypothetical protein VGF58_01290 [Burkholderiales bacterium]|jgi:hypothetical protein